MPKEIADILIKRSKGNVSVLERLLGLDAGALGNNPVRIDIPTPKNLRVSNGNEFGANEYWMPGGLTIGGIPEATIDPVLPGSYTVN